MKGVRLPSMRPGAECLQAAKQQKDPKWLIVYGVLVICVVCISLARALAFFEATFRCDQPAKPLLWPLRKSCMGVSGGLHEQRAGLAGAWP